MRLDKYLCDMGLGSRAQVKAGIRKGLAQVDGAVCREPERKIAKGQTVAYEGRLVSYVETEYYMLYKPAGVVSATEDAKEATVLELIGERRRKDLFPVGRLDKDTEGLLLLTNDGALAHRLLSPRRHVDKVYYARVEGVVRPEFVELFARGLDIGDEKPALPADLEIISVNGEGLNGQALEAFSTRSEIWERSFQQADISEIRLTLREGRFHQVKRMMDAVGCRVIYLKRLSMGPLKLDQALKPGEYRPLTEEELRKIKEL